MRTAILLLALLAVCGAGCRKPPQPEYDRPDDSPALTLDYRTALLKLLPAGPGPKDRVDFNGYDVQPRETDPGVFTISKAVTVLLRGCDRKDIDAALVEYVRGMGRELRRVGCEVTGPVITHEDTTTRWGYDYSVGDRTGAVKVQVGPVPEEADGYEFVVTVDVVERAPGTLRPAK